MLRQLSNIGLALTLLAGGSCGAFAAAALCPHVGCRTPSDAPKLTHSHDHGSPPAGRHTAPADAPGHHAHEPATPSEAGPASGESSSLLASHSPSCAHCMGRSEAPASGRERRAFQTKDDGRNDAPHASVGAAPPAPSFYREVIPHQGAPPGPAVNRHLLISVFRI